MNNKKFFAAPTDQGSPQSFCPNCGHPVGSNDTFCGNCGFDLKKFRQGKQSAQSRPNGKDERTSTTAGVNQSAENSRQLRHNAGESKGGPKQSLPRWAWWIIGAIVVLGIGGYVWGNHYYSREATLSRIIGNIRSNQPKAKDYTTSDPSLKLNSTTLKPMSEYLKGNHQQLAKFQSDLKKSDTSSDGRFTYTQTGKRWLMFPKYQIRVLPVYPKVSTNHSGVKITLDGKQIATSNSTTYDKQIGPYVPGNYQLKATGDVSGHHMVNSGTYHFDSSSTDYDLSLRTVSFNVNTAPGSTVYVDGKKMGEVSSDGVYSVTDMPWNDNMKVYATYPVSKGKVVTSDSTKISYYDDQSSVDVTYPDLISKDDADSLMSSVYGAITEVSQSGDTDDATDDDGDDVEDDFDGGSNSTDYQDLIKMAEGYHKNDDIESVDIDPDVKSVAPGVDGTSVVNFELTYTFGQDDHDHIQKFSYRAVVKKVNDHYVISSLDGLSKLDDHDEDY
ncbi:zinc ribbon domain-containing protein [Levilactobacillus bambusae]|nr:zinc-ribbon domain-containing protein [Levilactobacillus bambusae]